MIDEAGLALSARWGGVTVPGTSKSRLTRWLRYAILWVAVAGTVAGHLPEAEGQEVPDVRVTEQGVLLNFQDADLRVVIPALAELAGMTVVYSGLPSQSVTLRSPTPVPRADIRRMLEGLIRANGLALVEDEGFFRILPANAPDPAADPAGLAPPVGEGGIGLHVYRLRHARAEPLAQTLRDLFGLGSRPADLGVTPATLESLSEELSRQRIPLPPDAVFGAPAAPLAPALPMQAGGAIPGQVQGQVQIVPDATINALLVRASPADYAVIQAAIKELDARPLQVLIEVLIAEVRRDRRADLGVDITVPDQTDRETGITIGGELEGQSAGDLTLRVLGLGGVEADVILRALAASSRVSILSRPVILAKNNQQARILVGSQRPFIQLFRALPTETAVRDQIVQYRDVGTQLTIRPNINPDGYVSLYVLQEVSNATNEVQFGAPVISTREAETELLVRDGHTVVIGGLIDQQQETANSGIPILKDIPLLGYLFRSTQTRRSRTELFLLLTPHVLRMDADLDAATRELRDRSRDLRKELRDPIPLIERTGTVQRRP